MAETPSSPGHDPAPLAPAGEAEIGAGEPVAGDRASEGPVDLEAVLAAALDEDDLPNPHPPAPTPTLGAATARPTIVANGTPESEAAPDAPADASPGSSLSTSAVAAAGEPTVATTLEVAPLAKGLATDGGSAQGGEFDLLISKVKGWFEEADLVGQWDRLSGPLRGLGLLLGGVLVIKLYLALLDTLDDLPMLPRLLQLLGLIWLVNFSVTRLTRTSDRKEILEDWKRRWDAFRGS